MFFFMIQEFTLDLRAARRNSGLRQVDCAHLMGVNKTKVSNLENGRQPAAINFAQVNEMDGFFISGRDADGNERNWRNDIATRLLELQNDDGSWVNPESPRWWEGNKDLVTAWSVIALNAALQ